MAFSTIHIYTTITATIAIFILFRSFREGFYRDFIVKQWKNKVNYKRITKNKQKIYNGNKRVTAETKGLQNHKKGYKTPFIRHPFCNIWLSFIHNLFTNLF